VPISTGAKTLPFGTAPYVPTVQISQTKSDWVVVAQDPFVADAKVVLQCLAKCLNQHNFTVFDARDLMTTLPLSLPLISHDETICELEFLERERQGIVIAYANRYKRKASPVKLEGSPSKRPRLEVSPISSATRMLLDLLTCGPVGIQQAAERLQIKEKIIEQVVGVLTVIGRVTITNGLITSTPSFTSQCPPSPRPPNSSSSDDSYGPIPETPPQSMPMWDSRTDVESQSSSTSSHPCSTRSSSRCNRGEQEAFLPSPKTQSCYNHPSSWSFVHTPPPTQPPRSRECDRAWTAPSFELGSFIPSDKFNKSILNDMSFESNLDTISDSIADLFQSNFWDQY
jgi:hypothetical protein